MFAKTKHGKKKKFSKWKLSIVAFNRRLSGLQFLCFSSGFFCTAGEFDHVEYQGRQVKCRSSCEDQVGASAFGIHLIYDKKSHDLVPLIKATREWFWLASLRQ
jgi:hypothetical protein